MGILRDRDVACSAQTTGDRITNPVSGGPGGWPPLSSLLIEPTSSERPVLSGVPSETPDSKRNDKSDTFYQCCFNVGPTSAWSNIGPALDCCPSLLIGVSHKPLDLSSISQPLKHQVLFNLFQ